MLNIWIKQAFFDQNLKFGYSEFLRHMKNTLKKKQKPYWDTNAHELKEIFRCQTAGTVSKKLKYLEEKGYINIQKAWCRNGIQRHYRLYVSDKFLMNKPKKTLETRVLIKGGDFPQSQSPNNIIQINLDNNKTNKSSCEEFSKNKGNVETRVTATPKNSTVQDMIKIYNEVVHANVKLSKGKLPQFLYASFKQKFKTLEKWREYVKAKTRGFIENPIGYLKYLLKFININNWLQLFEQPNKKNNLDYVQKVELIRLDNNKFVERQTFYHKWLKIFNMKGYNTIQSANLVEEKMKLYDSDPHGAWVELNDAFTTTEKHFWEQVEQASNKYSSPTNFNQILNKFFKKWEKA